MIALKVIVGICIFTAAFSFFWYLQETKIIEKSFYFESSIRRKRIRC